MGKPLITIVDYSCGNIASLRQAFIHQGANVEVASTPEKIRFASILVLPGVGSFPTAMAKIKEMGMYSSYEPCIYPGVNIKYYFKESKSHGICDCEGICDGKGLKGNCKKITIVAFNSGAVMITGGKDIRHYHQVYEFISKLLNENRSLLEHK